MKRIAILLVFLAAAACQVAPSAAPAVPSTAPTRRLTDAPTWTGLAPVYVPALCTLMGRGVRTQVPVRHPVVLIWGWSAATEEQVRDYIGAAIVAVTFDGVEVTGKQLGGIPYDATAGLYKAVWAADLGPAKRGIHTTTYSLAFREKIFDGADYYGPGTKNEKQEDKCEIEVK